MAIIVMKVARQVRMANAAGSVRWMSTEASLNSNESTSHRGP